MDNSETRKCYQRLFPEESAQAQAVIDDFVDYCGVFQSNMGDAFDDGKRDACLYLLQQIKWKKLTLYREEINSGNIESE